MREEKLSNELTIIYDEKKYSKEVELIKKKYISIIKDISNLWGLNQDTKVKIYISKSTLKIIFLTLPLYKKIILGLVFPFWYINIRMRLLSWGSMTNTNKDGANILIKPIEVYDTITYGVGKNIFIKNKDKEMAFNKTFFNCMVVIYISSLKLSIWLEQGIAIYTVGNCIGERIVKEETINMLNENNYKKIYGNIIDVDDKTVEYNYVKGYWTIKYLEENYPGFLKETFKKNKVNHESEIMNKIGLNTKSEEEFWIKLDDKLYDYFKNKIK